MARRCLAGRTAAGTGSRSPSKGRGAGRVLRDGRPANWPGQPGCFPASLPTSMRPAPRSSPWRPPWHGRNSRNPGALEHLRAVRGKRFACSRGWGA